MSPSLPPNYDPRSTTLKPYLQLPHLLSLTWLAYPILSIIFVAFRLSLSLQSSQDAAASAKSELLASCKAAEQAATAAASMPRYMAIATNQQFADAVNDSMNAARAALVLSLTVMEAIINFIVDTYRSTFLCLLELVIQGGLAILIAAVNELNSLVEGAANGIRTAIQNDIGSANSAIQSAIDGINKVNPFGTIQAPQIPVPDLSSLQNVTLPSTFQDALTQLNSSLPTFNDLKQKIDSLIDTPFDLLKQDINETFSGLSFNSSVLPVPEQNTVSFCGDLDTSIVDDLSQDLVKLTKIGVIILIAIALILIALNCLLEWYKWRCMRRHLQYTREAWTTDPTMYHPDPKGNVPQVTLTDHNLLMLQANGSHPLLTRITNTLSARLRLSTSQHIHLSWFFHYIFHPPALACFAIGFFGLLSVEIQLAAIGPLRAKYSGQATAVVSNFSNTIATSINASMYNQSSAYANDVNTRVDAVQSSINDGLFGWVNGTTTTLNDTIATFYADIQSAVSLLFNGTLLEQPAQDFIQCFIGSKVDAIEEALTFLHDNLQIDIPRVNQSILVLSQASVNEATQPIATAAIGSGSDDNSSIIGKLVNSYVASLDKERIMFSVFMGLWGIVVLMGLVIIMWHSYGKQLLEKKRKRRWQKSQRGALDGLVVPFRERPSAESTQTGGASHENLPSFTPLPSPKPTGSFNPFRSASPPRINTEVLAEKSWDSFFSEKAELSRPRTISQPMKLMAIPKKAFKKERSETVSGQAETRNTAWFGRVASMLNKKQNKASEPQRRPDLRISINPPSSVEPEPEFSYAPRSRWSVSPTNTGWLSPKRQGSLPPAPKAKPRSAVPSDVTAVLEQPSLPAPSRPTPLAPPLHHGFGEVGPGKQRIPPSAIYYSPGSALVPPFPLTGHRRSSSVPNNGLPLTSATRASFAFAENPFVTPFDGEHSVTIDRATPRKSISVNPFDDAAANPFDSPVAV